MIENHQVPIGEEAIDAALHDLLAPASRPTLRHGFEQRLDRAIEVKASSQRKAAGLRRLLWTYWLVAGVASGAIGWQLRESLTQGAALWITLSGAAFLGLAVLSFSLLASVPMRPWRRLRSLGH